MFHLRYDHQTEKEAWGVKVGRLPTLHVQRRAEARPTSVRVSRAPGLIRGLDLAKRSRRGGRDVEAVIQVVVNIGVVYAFEPINFHSRPCGATAWPSLDQIKPIGQLVPVN